MLRLRAALAQINSTVGDISGNSRRVVAAIDEARRARADVVALPELVLTGYPPEDLVLRAEFVDDNRRALEEIVKETSGITAVIGFVDYDLDVFNAAAVACDGALAGVYRKQKLPNYGVFDEDRYFQAGTEAPVYGLGEVRFGVNICEDIWYPGDPLRAQALAGADVIFNINGSPYQRGKRAGRERMIATRAADNACIVAYVNMVGGQDELVFDGGSVIFDQDGTLVARARQFDEELLVVDLDIGTVRQGRLHTPLHRKERQAFRASAAPLQQLAPSLASQAEPALPASVAEPLEDAAEVWEALRLGTRDYVRKCGFSDVVIGLSGGIDSSVVACIAVDALGPEHVTGVSMPSRYSSEHSKSDAGALADALGIRYETIPIEQTFQATLETLSPQFAGRAAGLAEENLQPRIRGNILMSLSNKFGWLVLTTGNKSETATGYTTLYGDMAGGFMVIKDVPKMLVYELGRHYNRKAGRDAIPESVFVKPPSAELRPDQTDQDSLPPYEVLDAVLQLYVEEDRPVEDIVALGFDEAVVRRVAALVLRNEYKRRQAPPGVKITPRAFGRDRRFPIANAHID
jgi:NAD+ synthase (glutamine-hydrolysing)